MQDSWNAKGPGIAAHPDVGPDRRGGDCGGACLANDPESVVLAFNLENDPALISGVIAQIIDVVGQLRLFDEATSERIGVALHEAMLNGIHHGNLELDSTLRLEDEKAYHRLAALRRRMPCYRWRQLHVLARLDSAGASIVIRDDGHGFDTTRLPDPTDPAILERPSGRGLILIRAFMDEVSFNASGNEISLIKRRAERQPAIAR
jgi:hypothetical protein